LSLLTAFSAVATTALETPPVPTSMTSHV
jgi:hypothetical protein